MADTDGNGGDRGEPTPPLELSEQTAHPGDQVHIRLVGPPGGVAQVGFVPLSAPTGTGDGGPGH